MNDLYKGGFSFLNYERNMKVGGGEECDKKLYTKTGTTIVGIQCGEATILAADTRATAGLVMDKNCDKIHFIAENITCCGAGTAADNEYVTS